MVKFNKAYGTEGPLGLPMADGMAREIEGLLKGLNSDCRALVEKAGGPLRIKRSPEKFELLPGERADVSLVTTDSVDRDKEVVLPRGGDWKSWLKGGGVVTWAHDYSALPVGRGLWIKAVEEPANGWLAKTRYTPRPEGWPSTEGWFPDAVFHFVQEGIRGKSIGFIPTDVSRPTEDEIVKRPELAAVSWVIRKWIGLEYAVAPVQSNPDAVVIGVSKAKAKGLFIPQTIFDALDVQIPDGPDPEGTLTGKTTETRTKPEPQEGESESEFMSRCMAYPDLQDKPQDERAALCHGLWEQGKSSGEQTRKDATATATPPAPRTIPPEEAAGSRTPGEITREMEEATLQAVDQLDVEQIVADTIDRMRGRV